MKKIKKKRKKREIRTKKRRKSRYLHMFVRFIKIIKKRKRSVTILFRFAIMLRRFLHDYRFKFSYDYNPRYAGQGKHTMTFNLL